MLRLLRSALVFIVPLMSIQADTPAQAAEKNTTIKKHSAASPWPEGKPRFSPLYSRTRWSDRDSKKFIALRDVGTTLQTLEAGFFRRARVVGDVLGEPSGDYSDAAWIRQGFANQFSGLAALEKMNSKQP